MIQYFGECNNSQQKTGWSSLKPEILPVPPVLCAVCPVSGVDCCVREISIEFSLSFTGVSATSVPRIYSEVRAVQLNSNSVPSDKVQPFTPIQHGDT